MLKIEELFEEVLTDKIVYDKEGNPLIDELGQIVYAVNCERVLSGYYCKGYQNPDYFTQQVNEQFKKEFIEDQVAYQYWKTIEDPEGDYFQLCKDNDPQAFQVTIIYLD